MCGSTDTKEINGNKLLRIRNGVVESAKKEGVWQMKFPKM